MTTTTVTYPAGANESVGTVVETMDAAGGCTAVVLSETAFHPIDTAWPDQPADRGELLLADGRRVPVILFTKNGGQWLEHIACAGADALGIDWSTELSDARARVGHKVALQGNLDPNVLFARPSAIRAEVARVLESYGHGPGHVFNLGHGISQFTNPDHVTAFMEALHDLSPQYHQGIPTQTNDQCPGAKQ